MATVLLGFADALAAPEATFSLLAAEHNVRAFVRRGVHAPLGRLPIGDLIEITPPETDATAAASDLRAVLESGTADVVLGLDDTALWLIDQAGANIASASATGSALRYALDKSLQLDAARSAGIPTPQTAFVRSGDQIPDDMPFPAIMKPSMAIEVVDGALAKGEAFFLQSREDAVAAPERAAEAAPYMVQPLIRGVGEGVFGFAGPEGPTTWFGHQRVRMMNPHGSGASASRPKAPGEALRAAAEKMIVEIGWRGPFMIELLTDADGTAWFMEMNGRLWGSTALARRMGFEFPAWAVAQALDPDFVPTAPPPSKPVVVRHLGRDLLHLAFLARGPKSAFHREGWPSLLAAAPKALAPAWPSRFYNFDRAHPTFFLKEAASTVFRHLKRSP